MKKVIIVLVEHNRKVEYNFYKINISLKLGYIGGSYGVFSNLS